MSGPPRIFREHAACRTIITGSWCHRCDTVAADADVLVRESAHGWTHVVCGRAVRGARQCLLFCEGPGCGRRVQAFELIERDPLMPWAVAP